MSGVRESQLISALDGLLASADLRSLFLNVSRVFGQYLRAERSIIVPVSEANIVLPAAGKIELKDSSDAVLPRGPFEWTRFSSALENDHALTVVAKFFSEAGAATQTVQTVADVRQSKLNPALREAFESLGIRSYLLVGCPSSTSPFSVFAAACSPEAHDWQKVEVDIATRIITFSLRVAEQRIAFDREGRERNTPRLESLHQNEERYHRLVEHSDAIIFNTDPNHSITFISRRALDFFGVAPEDLLTEGRNISWFELIHPDDRERVRQLVNGVQAPRGSLDEEFQVVNQVTGRVRWLYVRLVPTRKSDGTIAGWDGFGVDVTSRREAQAALEVQSRKVRALYTVSAAIRGYVDPVSISTRGLSALCDATGASGGVCFIYSSQLPVRSAKQSDNKDPERLSLIAHYGLSPTFEHKADLVQSITSLAAFVSRQGQSLVIPDVLSDPRVQAVLSEEEEVRSLVFVPIVAEDETLGAIGLFSHEIGQFDGGAVMFVGAAANQIGLAARQANLFSLYRKQTKNLSALYRMSHELTSNSSLEQLFQAAFTIIRDELGLKRLWLGLLNEAGTRIVGQAAYGPGWKRRLVEINVEISGREHPVARVVATRSPVVIEDPNELLREFGVKRIFSRLAIHSVAVVPLMTSGQLLGVLAVQPGQHDPLLDEEELTLLSSLANEIAVSILARRLEDRVAEGEKMRTAGLLASGIAHNFNNVLQAILGQASLLEMQSDSPERALKASRIIGEAAAKGAALVKQLLSFAHLEDPMRDVCDVNEILRRNAENFQRMLGSKQQIVYHLTAELPRAYVDPNQLVRVLGTLVGNAHDAMPEGGEIEIFTDYIEVSQEKQHFEVPWGKYIRIGVRDTGVGMDEETRRRCFEPFFTTKNLDPSSGLGLSGSGLGLAAAYSLARKNGGRLVAESQLGIGSVFTFYIPVWKKEAAAGAQASIEVNLESQSLTSIAASEHGDQTEGKSRELASEDPDEKLSVEVVRETRKQQKEGSAPKKQVAPRAPGIRTVPRKDGRS